jgi:hypothetical protein
VVVTWNRADVTSGVASDNASWTLSGEGAGQSATGICTDQAGNSASDTQTSISIDKTKPTLNPVVSPNPVPLRGSASVTSGAADTLAGLASQSCGALDTGSAGSKIVSCTASDKAGNTASASAGYQVISAFAGFFQPIDNLPTTNTVRAGQPVPVKFGLGRRSRAEHLRQRLP